MKEERVFYELARGLTDEERQQLIDKIKKSIRITGSEEIESISVQESGEEEKNSIIQKEMEKIGFFQRAVIWIKTKLSGKTRQEVFIRQKIKQIKGSILKNNPQYLSKESRRISSKIAEDIFALYTLTLPIKRIFLKIWVDIEVFERGILRVFNKEIPGAKRTVTDLITYEELQEIYLLTGTKKSIKEEILKRLEIYLKSIPDSIFNKVEEEILPIYIIKDLVLYPYRSLFKFFQFSASDSAGSKKADFKDATSYTVINYMKKLESAILGARSVKIPIVLQDEFISFVVQLYEMGLNQDPQGEKSSLRDFKKDKEKLIKDITELMNNIFAFQKRVPLRELIQYHLQDPYYSVKTETPEINLKDFYLSVLKIRFTDEIEELFPQIKNNYIENKIKKLFEGKSTKSFINYKEFVNASDYKKLNLPFFNHTKSLNILYNYIYACYKENVLEIVKIINRTILVQNHSLADQILSYCTALEELEEKIEYFDYSLSPEAEDGKLLQRIQFSLNSDPSQHKVFRTLVVQKEKEVLELLERGKEAVSGLIKILKEILVIPGKNVQTLLANHFLIRGKVVTLREVLKERIDNLSDFYKLYEMIVAVENG